MGFNKLSYYIVLSVVCGSVYYISSNARQPGQVHHLHPDNSLAGTVTQPKPTPPSANEPSLSQTTLQQPKLPENIAEPSLVPPSAITETADLTLWRGSEQGVPSDYQDIEDPRVNRAYFELNSLAFTSITDGKQFDLHIPQIDQHFEVLGTQVEFHQNGDRTITGKILDLDGHSYSVVFTHGEHGTFGNVTTPQGSYVIESNNADGWIASATDLHNLQDFSKPDYIVPNPNNHLQPTPEI
ncbi:hypothetical protein AHAT_01640 [Agarivorans sp. Toyoura001]|uniref:hypothetical protein n=1 Tax=Agarivorans sp. Toyoura001 TaxID=2283141 RepID=UPI0010E20DBA|nr:hypothetical protein [Agarivorans sp. Toyoura001]GDY24274.1 hypothetical protein AHAT_01640 [Agarivorans sp. Toyoura001]